MHDDFLDLTMSLVSTPIATAELLAGQPLRDFDRHPVPAVQAILDSLAGFTERRYEVADWRFPVSQSVLRSYLQRVVQAPGRDDPVGRDVDDETIGMGLELDLMIDPCMAAPIVPIENSWPQMESLSTAILEAGGAGAALGLAVGTGVVPPIALVTLPVGVLVLSAARGLNASLVRRFDHELRLQLESLRALERDGLISKEEYMSRREQILDSYWGPRARRQRRREQDPVVDVGFSGRPHVPCVARYGAKSRLPVMCR